MPEPQPTPADLARGLMRANDSATLATLTADGEPYASLALLAADHDATPLLLLSDLVEHSRNIAADVRASLLVDGTRGLHDRLTGARVSVQGRAMRTDLPRHRDRFLARHPSASVYADFADFAFYRIEVTRAHLPAGFGAIHWIDGADLLRTDAASLPLGEAESEIIEHMNAHHADAVQLYANVLMDQEGDGWILTGVDPEGVNLRLGGSVGRLDFARYVPDAEAARVELVRLAKQARGGDGGDER